MTDKELTVSEKQVLGAISDGEWDYIKVDRALYREIMAELRGVEAAKERAWDEGWAARRRYWDGGSYETNPYRLPKGPTK